LLACNGWGGAERLGCTVYRMAREAGHEVRLDAFGSPAVEPGIRSEIGVDPGAGAGESTLWGWARAARRRARLFEPDLIHVHLAWPSLSSAAALIVGRTPHLLTFHLLASGDKWPKDYLLRLRSARVIRALGRVSERRILTAVSAIDQQRLVAAFPRDRVELVRNAPPLPPAAGGPALDIAWQPGAVRLLSVARICHQKGLDRAANALAAPELRAMPWHWVIVGQGDREGALQSQIVDLGLAEKVTFAGAHPAHELIRTADLVLSPSRSEGMPLVPLEAVLNGVPIVVSSIAPHEELFGEISLSLLPSDEAAWPTALVRLVGNESARAELRAAQQRLAPALGRERMWNEYEAIYRQLAASGQNDLGESGTLGSG
jgi:glycosyltransferase involved in cell wall biosynthesis